MKDIVFDRQKRTEILTEREQLILNYGQLKNELESVSSDDSAREDAINYAMDMIGVSLEKTITEYYNILPLVQFSICPFTGEKLMGSFDPVALDGLWWMEFTRDPFPLKNPPDTFRVLRGAVNLNGLKPMGGRNNALIGPEVPYVIPRILAMPTMELVISQITLDNGYIVYAMAYFSHISVNQNQLTSAWLEKDEYYYIDSDGQSHWRIANDSWDFDIGNWIRRDKVHWILPGSDSLATHSNNPVDCPYANVVGLKFPQVIKNLELSTRPLPNTGSVTELFD